MRNDALSIQSMEFAVSVIRLVKCHKEQHETIISNQIGRAASLSVQISVRHSMSMENPTLLRSFKSR